METIKNVNKMKNLILVFTLIIILLSCKKPEETVTPQGCDCTRYSETLYDTSSVWIIETDDWTMDCVERTYFDGPIGPFELEDGSTISGYWKSYLKCD